MAQELLLLRCQCCICRLVFTSIHEKYATTMFTGTPAILQKGISTSCHLFEPFHLPQGRNEAFHLKQQGRNGHLRRCLRPCFRKSTGKTHYPTAKRRKYRGISKTSTRGGSIPAPFPSVELVCVAGYTSVNLTIAALCCRAKEFSGANSVSVRRGSP